MTLALRPNAGGLLERAAEMIGAETRDVGEDGEREVLIEMRLNLVTHAPQPLRRKALVAGRQGKVPGETLGEADTQSSAQALDQDPVRETIFDLLGQSRDDLAQQGVLQPMQEFKPGCCHSKFGQQAGYKSGSQTT
jgi:hypothetical protein